jgi:Transglycosylase SLT domain
MAIRKKKVTRRHRKPTKIKEPLPPIHPWRICPYGEHWVRTHPLHVPPSDRYPEGHTTIRHEHCATNPSGRDQLYPEEITEIAKQHFSGLKNMPCPITPGKDTKYDGQYDNLIAGWSQYWNDILKPDEPLDPNLVKALIYTESRFNPKILAPPKTQDSARGLMQVTNESREILADTDGEITDHYITVTRDELNDPNTNICAGIRWLFHKRSLLSSKLHRQASWKETVYDFKGNSKASSKTQAEKIMKEFEDAYGELKECKHS